MKKTVDFFKTNPLGWMVAFFGFVAAIYYIGKQTGKRDVKAQEYELQNLPNSGSGLPKEWADSQASGLVDEMRDALSIYFYHIKTDAPKVAIMGKWNALTDDQLTVVANKYQTRYGIREGVSIVEAVDKQYMWPFDEEQKKLYKRLRALNFQ